jgi:nitric oxide reductase large subunit
VLSGFFPFPNLCPRIFKQKEKKMKAHHWSIIIIVLLAAVIGILLFVKDKVVLDNGQTGKSGVLGMKTANEPAAVPE